jgi:hypothetical protein
MEAKWKASEPQDRKRELAAIGLKAGATFIPSLDGFVIGEGDLRSITSERDSYKAQLEGMTTRRDELQDICFNIEHQLHEARQERETYKAHAEALVEALIEANRYVARRIGRGTPEESNAALELRQRIDALVKVKKGKCLT